MPQVIVEELKWSEQPLGEIRFPKEVLQLSAGFGSGLTTRPGSNEIWAISDRGPNLKIEDVYERYGWQAPAEWQGVKGAKLMPRPDIGPSLAQLSVEDGAVLVERVIRLSAAGMPVSGLPIPETGHAECEPVLDLDGRHVEPDPTGMDTEGLALLEDGGFWASEEYGPSLVRLAPDGQVLLRLLPEGIELPDADYPVRATLPALAARRHLNRGFEAVAATPSGRWLYLAFQSPLAHPGTEQHERGRHVRLWRLDADGNVIAQFLYRLDDPESFARDNAKGKIGPSDIKVCEVAALCDDVLLVLERASETSKIYRVWIDEAQALPPEQLSIDARPTVEMQSCDGAPLPELSKELLFTSDEHEIVGADIEGMALLDPRTLLIVSDNDFGCEGKQTRFFRLRFGDDLLRGGA